MLSKFTYRQIEACVKLNPLYVHFLQYFFIA